MTTKNVHSYFTDISADSPLVGSSTKCNLCSAVLKTTHGNTSSLRHQKLLYDFDCNIIGETLVRTEDLL
jgi:hypothetical protein